MKCRAHDGVVGTKFILSSRGQLKWFYILFVYAYLDLLALDLYLLEIKRLSVQTDGGLDIIITPKYTIVLTRPRRDHLRSQLKCALQNLG